MNGPKVTAIVFAFFSAASTAAANPLPLPVSIQTKANIACVIDAAYAYDDKTNSYHFDEGTPTKCFAMTGDGRGEKFWQSFSHEVKKPNAMDEVSALYEFRTGTIFIGEEQLQMSAYAQNRLGVCWATLDHLRSTKQPVPIPACN